jgi:2-phosphosulfolactate phosphatase
LERSSLAVSNARCLDLFLLPDLARPEDLAGRTAVVIDVLRATTTIAHALAAGAKAVVPCGEVEQARQVALRLGADALLAGERGGLPIPGFDLGNSPAEFTAQRVEGKTIVFTTTNGTRALLRCTGAEDVLLAAFVNFSAVCTELAGRDNVAIVCAGTDGQVTREDVLLAGAIVDDLVGPHPPLSGHATESDRTVAAGRKTERPAWRLNDQAEIAVDAWRTAVRLLTDRPLGLTLRASQGGRNLIEIGQENDIDLAAQIDRFDLVPRYDPASGLVVRV